jgi:hypothetical protein
LSFQKQIRYHFQISEFIHQKADEKRKLEEEIQTLKSQIKILKEEKSNSEHRRASTLHEENMTSAEVKSYSDMKEELHMVVIYA